MKKKNLFKIFGAKGKIENVDNFLKYISNFAQKNNLLIQVFDADMIFGEIHIFSAFKHAQRAVKRKTNTTNSLEMEIILYASGERQLKLAIPKMGIKKGIVNIAFILISKKNQITNKIIDELLDSTCLNKDDQVLFGNINTLKNFGVNEHEINTVTKPKYEDLILEKVAMVDVIK